jgi:hypothetical protein
MLIYLFSILEKKTQMWVQPVGHYFKRHKVKGDPSKWVSSKSEMVVVNYILIGLEIMLASRLNSVAAILSIMWCYDSKFTYLKN